MSGTPFDRRRPPPTPPSQGGEPREAPPQPRLPPLRRGGWEGSVLGFASGRNPIENRSNYGRRLPGGARPLTTARWLGLVFGLSVTLLPACRESPPPGAKAANAPPAATVVKDYRLSGI